MIRTARRLVGLALGYEQELEQLRAALRGEHPAELADHDVLARKFRLFVPSWCWVSVRFRKMGEAEATVWIPPEAKVGGHD